MNISSFPNNGRIQDFIAGVALSAFALIFFFLSFRTYFHGGESYEFCHYAEIASNILNHEGFCTRTYYPTTLAYFKKMNVLASQRGPVVDRFAFFAYWSAFWMAIGGRNDFGMALGNAAAHALWVALLYSIGVWLFNRRTALLAAVLWAIQPVMTAGYDLFGYPDVLFGFLFGVLNVLFFRFFIQENQLSWGKKMGVGILAGLAYLTRYSFSIWLPLYIFRIIFQPVQGRWRQLGLFLAGFLIPWLCWMGYAGLFLGLASPPLFLWNLASETVVSGLPWLEYRTYSFGNFLSLNIAGKLIHKSSRLLWLFLKHIPSLWKESILFPFASIVMGTGPDQSKRFARWIGLLFLCQILIFSFLRYDNLNYMRGRYYLWFAPFVLLYAAAFFMVPATSTTRQVIGAAVMGFLLFSWIKGYCLIPRASDHPSHLPISEWPEVLYLRHENPNDWIATNIPAQVAWYAGHPTVDLANSLDEMKTMVHDWPIRGIFVSFNRIGELGNRPEWAAMLKDSSGQTLISAFFPLGFRLDRTFPNGWLFIRTTPIKNNRS